MLVAVLTVLVLFIFVQIISFISWAGYEAQTEELYP